MAPMTDIAFRLQAPSTTAVAVERPPRWRLRGATMAAALVLGTAGSTATARFTDHGVAVAAITSAPTTAAAPTGHAAPATATGHTPAATAAGHTPAATATSHTPAATAVALPVASIAPVVAGSLLVVA